MPSADTAPTSTSGQAEKSSNDVDIVVTGSRIARPALESPVPVTSVSAENLLATGTINVGDALNELPALRSTFSQANSERFIGTSGVNFLDLRGLGTSRTLVLVNGRRHVTSSPGDYLVDINTIPTDLLESTDIVTGGNSAIYGSDAVAGVVNFNLKRNFEGIRLSGQGSVTSRGDRGSYFGALTMGKNFAEGRGNIAMSLEYTKSNALYNTDRDSLTGAYSGRNQFNLHESTVGEPAAGNGVPDNLFYSGVRNGTIADGGLVTAVCSAASPAQLANPARCRPTSVAASATTAGIGLGQRYVFDSNGNLVLSTPSLDFRDITTNFASATPSSGSSNTIGGLGSTLENTGQLLPQLQRYSANILAHFDFSDAFRPFVEAKYVRINANQEGQPSFFQGSIPGFFGGGSELRCNNPFLTTQALTTLQSIGRCVNPATSVFTISRFNVDFGGRAELHKRETYRIVGGVDGTFNGDWTYNFAVNFGRFQDHNSGLNNLKLFDLNGNPDGFLLAANAVNAPAGFAGANFALGAAGQKVVCAVNAVTNTRPDCVPINVFGSGAPSAAALAFVNTTSTNYQNAEEFDVSLNITGNTGKFFEMPGGPVKFAVGGEYRSESAFSAYDALTASGGTFLNAIPEFHPPIERVAEGYAEIDVPILKDHRFFEELTASGAGRYSSYNTTAGGVWSYNAGIVWSPFYGVRFRGSYGHSVRAPTQSDLYTSPTQNFGFIADPCDAQNVNNGTQFRVANCSAAGIPAGFINDPARTQTLSFVDAGNPGLKAETSNSYTGGIVLEPHQIRGLSLSVDYYKIKVDNLISSVAIQTIVNQCYDSATLNNPYCALLFPRDPTTHLFATPYVGTASTLNFARQTTSGIDAELSYNRSFNNGSKVAFSGLLSWVADRTNYLDPINPTIPTRQLGNLGDPEFKGQFNVSYSLPSGVYARYQFQFIGKQSIGNYCDQHSCNGQPPQNADEFPVADYPIITYSNLRVGFNVQKKFEFYVGCDNIFDRLPPYGLLGTGAGSGIYNNVGRQFYAGFKANY
ncbi:TonB-dependent receptor domain-containing protein [uncultured Sphingomonas sp.]|uniref:TonB-dependent receptor domain-containing protein n=1 Tax=uncultured Sphingomonas sp. TaxID=158754 RepID=UPI0035C95D63